LTWEKEKEMKKYLLLIEDETLWDQFKKSLSKDINTEIIEMIQDKVKTAGASVNVLRPERNKNGKGGKK